MYLFSLQFSNSFSLASNKTPQFPLFQMIKIFEKDFTSLFHEDLFANLITLCFYGTNKAGSSLTLEILFLQSKANLSNYISSFNVI